MCTNIPTLSEKKIIDNNRLKYNYLKMNKLERKAELQMKGREQITVSFCKFLDSIFKIINYVQQTEKIVYLQNVVLLLIFFK